MSISMLQSKFTSLLTPERVASYDQEVYQEPTMMLIHSMSRFLYIREGDATIRINGEEYRMTEHSMIAILPWDVTQIVAVRRPVTAERIIYNFNFMNLYLRSDYNPNKQFFKLWKVMRKHPIISLGVNDGKRIEDIIERLRNEVGIESVFSECAHSVPVENFTQIYTVSLVVELLVLYNRALEKSVSEDAVAQNTVTSDKSNDGETEGFFIGDLLNYLYSHLSEKITLSRLNKIFYISQSTIAKRLKETLGYTFQELITSMRVYKAMDLLTYTDFNLQEIAQLVGMNDAAHLVHSFKSMEDMTPNEFRTNFCAAIEKKTHLKTSESSVALEVVNDILRHYEDPLTTPQSIAEKYHLTLAELNRVTLYYVERSASDFIAWLRVNKASELLVRTDMSVTEIAMSVGFKTLKTFYRYFRKHFSASPTELRERVHYQKADGTIEYNEFASIS